MVLSKLGREDYEKMGKALAARLDKRSYSLGITDVGLEYDILSKASE